jgi:hypothetical protein
MKQISNVKYVFINKQLISFQNFFGILPQFYQEKGSKTHISNLSVGNMLHVSNMLRKPALVYVLEQETFLFSKESRPTPGQIQSSLLFNEYHEFFLSLGIK